MKHVVRMLIALLIVGGIGFGIWYFAFRDKPNEAVFKEMTASINHLDEVSIKYNEKQSDGTLKEVEVVSYDKILAKFIDVSESGSVASGAEANVVDANDARVEIKNKVDEFQGYNAYSMEAINYYYSLTATAEKVKNRDKVDLVEKIEAFNNAVDTVVATAKDCLDFYSIKTLNTENEIISLADKDAVLLGNIIKKQVAQTELFFELRNYVEKYVFDGIIPDYKSAMYNIYANELNSVCGGAKVSKTTTVNNEKVYANVAVNTYLLEDLQTRIGQLENVNYIDENAVEFLNAYNKLRSNLSTYLQLTYNKKDANGQDAVDSNGEKLVCNREHFIESFEIATLAVDVDANGNGVLDEGDTDLNENGQLDLEPNYTALAGESGISIDIIKDVYNLLSYITIV